jgi:transcriptional regulator with XRE-family HTH domain
MGSFSEVSSLIKELRREHSLTQVQLANELGLSPATIYRYESGAKPETAALLALFRFAEKRGPGPVRNALREIVSERVELPNQLDLVEEHAKDAPFTRTLTRVTSQFNDREKLRLLAFATFIRENKDVTAERMIEILLSPWIERVNEKRSSASKEKD